MPREPQYIDRRLFLTGSAIALLAAACGSGGNAASPLAGATSTSAPPPPTSPPSTTPPTTTPATTAKPTGPAEFVETGPTAAPRVALTFHTDGDLGLVDQLVDVLSARRVPITAFVVGQWLDANPTYAKRLVDGGHELANHTYTHPSFASLSPAAMADEITRCRDVLTRLTGSGGTFFRPSGTGDGTARPADVVLAAAGTAGYPVVLGFDVDPLDYNQPDPDVVVQRVLDRVKAGSIVSLHFGYAGTVTAVPKILDGLAQRQLTPVTASQLLGR
jgi:peptidoglycan/xylan/chitin deacetylase (PgdA/CDA1 family)